MNHTFLFSFAKLILLVFFSKVSLAQSNSTFYLGHSLVNFQIPQMVAELAKDANSPMMYKANIGNGATLGWHWTQPHTGQGDRWDQTLNTTMFDNFILTEAVPLKGHLKWSDTYGFVDKFITFAQQRSPNIQLYVYETWHCIDSGTPTKCEWDDDSHIPWRSRLDQDFEQWKSIVEEHNNKHAQKALMIPGGQGLARLHDAIQDGFLPGYTSHRQLFSDNIHLTSIGNYFISCIMYSVLFKKSPEGLKNQLMDMYGLPFSPFPTPQQAQVLQKIAWETVCDLKDVTNVNCNVSTGNNQNSGLSMYFSYPNLYFRDSDAGSVDVYHITGQKMNNEKIVSPYNVSDFGPGIYFAKNGKGENIVFVLAL